MRVVIIGAGLVGLTSAYFLKRRGHEVIVIDRQDGPGRETSFANGGLLSPSMPEPWNAPGCWRLLLASLGRSDAPLQLHVRTLPTLMGWGVKFLRNSSPARYRQSTISNVRLALFSLKTMQSLRQQVCIEYGASARGTLKLFRSAGALTEAVAAAERLSTEGLHFRRLSRPETIELEPALGPIADQLAGAIHYAADETGDAYRFCSALAEQSCRLGVQFAFGKTVSALDRSSNRVTGVRFSAGEPTIHADHYILAAGSYSTPLLQPLGLRLPVRPAKGYSVTFDAPRNVLKVPIVDDDMHAAVVPVGEALRVAGTAEFAGFDLSLRTERIRSLTNLVQKILPRAGLDPFTARPWCGLRPMSADGVPVIGHTPFDNLWVNSGHGHLGWTMAAGSGQLLAQLLSKETPSLDPKPYSPARFD